MVGIKYQTFASWVQKRRRAHRQYPVAPAAKALPSTTADALRLVEAVVDRGEDRAVSASGGESLWIHLPSGARIEVRGGLQAPLAAALLRALTAVRPC